MLRSKIVISASAFLLVIAMATSTLFLGGCSQSSFSDTLSEDEYAQLLEMYSGERKLIIDCDGGGDDAAAILTLAACDSFNILGVTCVQGNADLATVCASVLMDLEISGRNDVCVYAGNNLPDQEKRAGVISVYGADGMGEQDLIHPSGSVQELSAVDFIIQTVRDNPDEVEIAIIGPATNIAAAIEQAPDVMSHVRCYWIMGTAGFGYGNATPVAEYNVYNDVESFDILLNSSPPKIIVPLNTSIDAVSFTGKEIQAFSKLGDKGAYIAKAESKLVEYEKTQRGSDYATLCDVALAAVMVDLDTVTSFCLCYGVCITEESAAHAQVVFYKKDVAYEAVPASERFNVSLITGMDPKKTKAVLKNALKD